MVSTLMVYIIALNIKSLLYVILYDIIMYHQYLKVAWPFIFSSTFAYVAAGIFFSKITWTFWNELHSQKMLAMG